MIITDLNYCKRCRIPNSYYTTKTNYCPKCSASIGKHLYNRYNSSIDFINTSFQDCVVGNEWLGFNTKLKYKNSLISNITEKFADIKFVIKNQKVANFKKFFNEPFLYLVSDSKKQLLKIGQTVNPYNRFNRYYNISEYKPLTFDLFLCDSFEKQDLYEDKLRNYLEFLGYVLPKDNTNNRLKYIERI